MSQRNSSKLVSAENFNAGSDSEIGDFEGFESVSDTEYEVEISRTSPGMGRAGTSNTAASNLGECPSSPSSSSDSQSELGDGGKANWEKVTVTRDDYVPLWCPQYTRRAGSNFPPSFLASHKQSVDYFYLLFP